MPQPDQRAFFDSEAGQTALLLLALLSILAIGLMAAGLVLMIHRWGRALRERLRRKRQVRYGDLRGELELYAKPEEDDVDDAGQAQ